MKIFFDTEFTSVEDINAGLISIGLTTEEGHEFYAELTDTYDLSMCSDFVIETVLQLLDGGSYRMTFRELAVKLKAWIEAIDAQELILISDSPPLDFPFVSDLFDKFGWPNNLPKKCEPLYFWISEKNGEKFHRALEDFWLLHADRQHHALMDARSLQFAWSACQC